jgi:RimJ/RimL family protein N-acetyltransferase
VKPTPPLQPGQLDRLCGERLVLRRPTLSDRDDVARMHRDEVVMATLGGVRSDAESDALLARLIAHWDAHDFGYWMARDLETDRFCGRAGLRHVVTAGRPETELGYALTRECWGRGLATEAAAACVRAGFETIGLEEIVCFTTLANQRSLRVMEKVGFRYERDFLWAGLPHRLCRLERARWRESYPSEAALPRGAGAS